MLLLSRSEVVGLLTMDDYIGIVEDAFRAYENGDALEPALSHVDAEGGEFHIKAGGVKGARPRFALKVNGGFFQNRAKFGLPNIQGLIVLSDAANGTPLAAMDSMEITIQRTGAATAVAAKYLAPNASVCTICGCGTQGRIQLRALSRVLPLKRVFAWSRSEGNAAKFAETMSAELDLVVTPMPSLREALAESDVCVTCTPARGAFVEADMVRPGTFIAAVGADSPDKQELDPVLVARSTVIADLRKQSSEVGEVHHAIARGLMSAADIFGELGQLVSGKIQGRRGQEDTIIFDSTGTALQDAAAASAVYERACAAGIGTRWEVAG